MSDSNLTQRIEDIQDQAVIKEKVHRLEDDLKTLKETKAEKKDLESVKRPLHLSVMALITGVIAEVVRWFMER